jgi:uncharacterized membrane protein (UPF0127 family)
MIKLGFMNIYRLLGSYGMVEQIISIYHGNKVEVLLRRVKVTRSCWERLRGLRFYREFPEIDGLLFYPCHFVYTIGMRFAVDFVYLNRSNQVLLTVDALVPYKFGPFLADTYYIMEVPAGTVAVKNIKLGERLQW